MASATAISSSRAALSNALPDKAGAVIIRDKKLLLVSDDKTPFFWMPGGKCQGIEEDLACLARELTEELQVKLVTAEYLTQATFLHEKEQRPQTIRYYACLVSGEPEPHREITRLRWLTRADYNEQFPMTTVCRTVCMPYLIKNRLF